MMKVSRPLILAALLSAASATADAAVIYATSVDSYVQGSNTNLNGLIPADRLVLSNATGAPDGKFLSLGLLGEAVFSFGQQFTLPGAVFEITYGNRTNYLESVDVYAGYEGVFSFLVSLTNSADGALSFNYSGVFDQLKFADTSPSDSKRDGFDIDAVSVTTLAPTPVPLPAGGLMLLAAIGAVGMLGRRRS